MFFTAKGNVKLLHSLPYFDVDVNVWRNHDKLQGGLSVVDCPFRQLKLWDILLIHSRKSQGPFCHVSRDDTGCTAFQWSAGQINNRIIIRMAL